MKILQLIVPPRRHYPNGEIVSMAADSVEAAIKFAARVYDCKETDITVSGEFDQTALIYSGVKRL